MVKKKFNIGNLVEFRNKTAQRTFFEGNLITGRIIEVISGSGQIRVGKFEFKEFANKLNYAIELSIPKAMLRHVFIYNPKYSLW